MTHAQHHGSEGRDHQGHAGHSGQGMYKRFAAMIAISFVAMYILMYAMVDSFGNVFNSLNQVYMAGLMAASMVIIELALMWGMYRNRRLNFALLAGGVVALVLCWIGIRQQAGIGDTQFLRSMIPHHAGAILMCEQASITDVEIQRLCQGILESQASEIAQMKSMLSEGK